MRYKTISFLGKKFKFNRGINSISFDDYQTFDILSSPLMAISKIYDNSFEPFFDSDNTNFSTFPSEMSANFGFLDGSEEIVNFEFCDCNSVNRNWLAKNKDFAKKIIEKEKNKPILAYYRRGNCVYQDSYGRVKKYDLINFYSEREYYPWKEWNKEYNFFSQLAINSKYKKDEYSCCHYQNIKKIIDEILNVTFSENFEFAVDCGRFVYYNNGRCYSVATESYDLGITVGMIMQLYISCLSQKEPNFIGYPCDSSGIIICNYNFGERPSYSDKKWDYYKIFSKYFPNLQFIVC